MFSRPRWATAGIHHGVASRPAIGSNPMGVEGYKTITYEIAEAMEWRVSRLVRHTGLLRPIRLASGSFEEMRALGWIERVPRLLAAEVSGSLTQAMEQGLETPPVRELANASVATSIGAAQGTYQGLVALRASQGRAVFVEDAEILAWQAKLARLEAARRAGGRRHAARHRQAAGGGHHRRRRYGGRSAHRDEPRTTPPLTAACRRCGDRCDPGSGGLGTQGKLWIRRPVAISASLPMAARWRVRRTGQNRRSRRRRDHLGRVPSVSARPHPLTHAALAATSRIRVGADGHEPVLVPVFIAMARRRSTGCSRPRGALPGSGRARRPGRGGHCGAQAAGHPA